MARQAASSGLVTLVLGVAASSACAAAGRSSGGKVAADAGQAAQLYERACDAGNARACTNLGVLFKSGSGQD